MSELLNNEHTELYGNVRIAVGVALFIGYLSHYGFQGLSYFGNKKKDHMIYMTKRIWLFGIMCALSVGYIQGSVYTAIFAWLTLPFLVLIHAAIFLENQKIKEYEKYFWLGYYGMLVLWGFGLIIDCFGSEIANYSAEDF